MPCFERGTLVSASRSRTRIALPKGVAALNPPPHLRTSPSTLWLWNNDRGYGMLRVQRRAGRGTCARRLHARAATRPFHHDPRPGSAPCTTTFRLPRRLGWSWPAGYQPRAGQARSTSWHVEAPCLKSSSKFRYVRDTALLKGRPRYEGKPNNERVPESRSCMRGARSGWCEACCDAGCGDALASRPARSMASVAMPTPANVQSTRSPSAE